LDDSLSDDPDSLSDEDDELALDEALVDDLDLDELLSVSDSDSDDESEI